MRQYAPDYVRKHGGEAVPQVQSTLAKLSLCRTVALGGRRYRCGSCLTECTVYNSCGDRHCPLCSGAKRADWLTSTAELLLPGIDYFQVVFTIPDKLSSLALGNRRAVYTLLFQSAWRALHEVIEAEQGFEASAAMVLHTWNQKLEPHAHVHAVVPGGGPALRGERRWVHSHRRDLPHSRAPYLVEAQSLRDRFREVFLDGLRCLHRSGGLKLNGDWSALRDSSAFDAWLKPLVDVTWVTYIEPPPSEQSTPEHVLKYLARYLTGGPISDRRLISHDDGHVTFWARTGQTSGGGDGTECEPYTLSGTEFVRRWSRHILPKGYVKPRRFGGYSNRQRQRYLAECRDLLGERETPSVVDEVASERPDTTPLPEPHDEGGEDHAESCCPTCGAPMHCVAAEKRVSWIIVMHGSFRPIWYADG